MNSHTASIWSLVNLLIILLLSKDVLPLHMKAIHNKDYSVVKTFKAGLIRASLSVYKKRFEDVAYFEPFYLKEFVATISKKKLW